MDFRKENHRFLWGKSQRKPFYYFRHFISGMLCLSFMEKSFFESTTDSEITRKICSHSKINFPKSNQQHVIMYKCLSIYIQTWTIQSAGTTKKQPFKTLLRITSHATATATGNPQACQMGFWLLHSWTSSLLVAWESCRRWLMSLDSCTRAADTEEASGSWLLAAGFNSSYCAWAWALHVRRCLTI